MPVIGECLVNRPDTLYKEFFVLLPFLPLPAQRFSILKIVILRVYSDNPGFHLLPFSVHQTLHGHTQRRDSAELHDAAHYTRAPCRMQDWMQVTTAFFCLSNFANSGKLTSIGLRIDIGARGMQIMGNRHGL